jgi:hypothetical protein
MADHSRREWRTKILVGAENQYGECTNRQDNEARKNQNVKSSCARVPRMLPLPEPELQNLVQPQQRPVKAKVRRTMKEGDQALGYDVGKTSYAQRVN